MTLSNLIVCQLDFSFIDFDSNDCDILYPPYTKYIGGI